MIEFLLEPFAYSYMARAIWVSALVGALCGCLSGYLILKGWSLMGDALSHAVVPGVAISAIIGAPLAVGAFASGLIAAGGIALLRRLTTLKEDVAIGLIFTSFFALGLLIVSLRPTSISVQTIAFGNILAISDTDALQLAAISGIAFLVIGLKWRDLMLAFFDEGQARIVGLNPWRLRLLFFALLSAASVAALQAVGAILVIAMVVTPGATAYLLTDRFGRMLVLATAMGTMSGALGAYASFFLDGATGGLIVLMQTGLFLLAFLFAPKHGRFALLRQRSADT
ncbi:MAG: metal ABC transporter permease [Rhizobiales bacterium]|nr:metal ABC transporter permease [Hyphomicrobiales bacterium]